MSNAGKQAQAEQHKNDAVEAAKRNDYLNASFSIAQALKLFGEANDKTGLKEAKKLSVDYNKKAEEQMQTHEFSVELNSETREGLEAFVSELTKADNLSDNFERISKSRALVPRVDQAKKNAEEIVPVTAQLVTHFSIRDEGHLASVDDFDDEWFATHYNYQLELTMRILNEAYSRLILKKQFTEDDILNAVSSRKVLGAEPMLKLKTVLERRFAGDYLSAVHVLVPLIEKTFMGLSGLVGLDTIAYSNKKISTRNSTLSSNILQSKEYQDAWGSDFCSMLDFFLLDINGYRFRHKIAHGDITVDECSFTSFNLLFYFLMKLIYMIKITAK